jgi:1,4-dihydroxy-2-naphthoate octaprenyltransferase
MYKIEPIPLSQLNRILNPVVLLAALAFYFLGMSISAYLGVSISWIRALIGFVMLVSLLSGGALLDAFFWLVSQPPGVAAYTDDRWGLDPSLPKGSVISLAVVYFGIGIGMVVLLLAGGGLTMTDWLVVSVLAILLVVTPVPPIQLAQRGVGELTSVFVLAVVAPALGQSLQSGAIHSITAVLTFPLFLLALSAVLASGLERFAADVHFNRKTILTRLGWQTSMVIHSVSILLAFIILLSSSWMGVPARLGLFACLALPVGLFQLWLVYKLGQGAPPFWKLIRFISLATPALTVYLLIFNLWLG